MNKNVLFINGCIRGEHSRTQKIADTYIAELKKQGGVNVIERNLNETEVCYLTTSSFDKATGKQKHTDDRLAKEFALADEIVFAAPFWEFLFPAVVSCYFETISLVGVTFTYTERGSKGLCNASSFKYIYTAGNYLSEDDKLSEKYLKHFAAFFGITDFSSIYVDGLDINVNDAEKFVDKACQDIRSQFNR